jgi:hypothetical protein
MVADVAGAMIRDQIRYPPYPAAGTEAACKALAAKSAAVDAERPGGRAL